MFEVLKKSFSINLNDYENININLEINKVVAGVCIALIISIILFSIYRKNIRLVVSQLSRHGAKDEESAKTLTQLGLDNSWIIRKMLSSDNLLTKIVARTGEYKYDYDEYVSLSKEERRESEKVDFSSATFYIKSDKEDLSRNVIEKYDSTWQGLLFASLFIVIVTICIISSMPEILNILNNMLKKV